MGKWSTYQKRGTAGSGFLLSPPLDTEWSLNAPAATSVSADKLVSFPGPADKWILRAIRVSDSAITNGTSSTGTTASVTGLVTATAYNIQAAWVGGVSGQRLSNWSASKPVTTA